MFTKKKYVWLHLQCNTLYLLQSICILWLFVIFTFNDFLIFFWSFFSTQLQMLFWFINFSTEKVKQRGFFLISFNKILHQCVKGQKLPMKNWIGGMCQHLADQKREKKVFYVQQTNSKPNFLNLSHASDFCAWKIISVFHKIYLIKSIKHEWDACELRETEKRDSVSKSIKWI